MCLNASSVVAVCSSKALLMVVLDVAFYGIFVIAQESHSCGFKLQYFKCQQPVFTCYLKNPQGSARTATFVFVCFPAQLI